MFRSLFYKIAFGIAAIFTTVFTTSCSTELDPNAEYKEIMVIYGILNASDQVHFIKVNKAFLNTNSNALTIAATTDSTTYKDSLKVELQLLQIAGKDTTVETAFPLSRTVVNNKDDDGDFQYPTQVLYKTGNVTLDQDRIYRVMATNIRTQVSAYAFTPIVKDFCVRQVGGTPFNCGDTTEFKKFKPENLTFFTWEPAVNAEIYKIALDFDYLEITGNNTVPKTVNWVIQNNYLQSSTNSTNIVIKQSPKAFFEHIRTVVPPVQAGTSRVAGEIRVHVTAGSKTMATYFLVNNTFSAITQTRPEFDNVTGGTGLFASRRTVTTKAKMDLVSINHLRAELPNHGF